MSPLKKTLLIVIMIPVSMAVGLAIKNRFIHYPATSDSTKESAVVASSETPRNVVDASVSTDTKAAYAVQSSVQPTTGLKTIQAMFTRQPDTYQIAMANYEDQRIQFDNCDVTIPRFGAVVKSGADIMIEGSSPDTQFVYLNNQRIVLNGYAFALIKAPTVRQKQTFTLNCETSDTMQYNVSTLTVYP